MIIQLKKGVLEFCVLSIISKEELYGYEIARKVLLVFLDTSEQAVYTILRRLLKEGYTECYSKEVSKGPPRKYYKLTNKGQIYYSKCEKDWDYITNCVNLIKKDENF